MRYTPLLSTQLFLLLPLSIFCKLECDPTSNVKKSDPSNPESYLYCNLEGSFSKRKCLSGKIFNSETGSCESLHQSDDPIDDPFSKPFYQAPDDLCGGGIPLTILSAPVACNPSISSCPDGYSCRMYERTGTSYCCQGSTEPSSSSNTMCSSDQVTYIEPSTGKPRSCVLTDPSSCPNGFGCNLVGGTTTRCCGKDLGCPFNSAAFLHPETGSMVRCSTSQRNSCQRGFSCVRSSILNNFICCSTTDSSTDNSVCPGGESALSSPSTCSASSPCPAGHSCREGKCCPSVGVCPVGLPLGGGPTICGEKNPCREGHQCVTNNGVQYCCPTREKVCHLTLSPGVPCASSRAAVTRYYFDVTTSTCRSFQFTQCGGNSNNFDTLEECEGFCTDTQCSSGQPYRVGAVNAACEMSNPTTCPRSYSCQSPLFGNNDICCPSAELTCNEMVSAGTPCFGQSITIQRYYFNPTTRKCQPFQYYGCNGNGNNFATLTQCNNHCLNIMDDVCGGVAPLVDPNQLPQRCTPSVPCPSGYECNSQEYCCPTQLTSCGAALSRGNACSGTDKRSMWYYDNAQKKCRQFTYNGCGGTPNRFSSQKACSDQCIQTSSLGSCPRGMTPHVERGEIAPKTCTLNVLGTCPSSASCVRSTLNQAICCQTVTSCPDNRAPYVIPGSTSVIACNVDANDCPGDNVCVESSSVPGFNMCCSSSVTANQRPPSSRGNKGRTANGRNANGRNANGRNRKQPDTMAALLKSISPCPPQLRSNGNTCTVNAIGDCPSNHICFREVGYEQGSCCRTTPPKCAQKSFIPVFVHKTQVQVCQVDLGGCPRDARCMTSTVAKLAICCKQYQPPPKNTNQAGGSAGGRNQPKCSNGAFPFYNGPQAQECNFVRNTCPTGYKCEFSSTGRPVCCADSDTIRCPVGSSAFEFGGRPLACPAGSTKCPSGYSCIPSINPQYHLCCSTGSIPTQPQCARGQAYVDPASNERRFCSPLLNNCPNGYHCMESDRPGQFICCTQGDLADRFKGFCPSQQIPYVSRDGFPPTCHMQLNPCPTTAPFICIYSPEKQDSFCCAPIETAVRSYLPDSSYAARPMKKLAPSPDVGLSSGSFPAPANSGMNGMTQTMPGGPMGPGMGPVGIPDPIPGVSQDRILPPGLVKSETSKPQQNGQGRQNGYNSAQNTQNRPQTGFNSGQLGQNGAQNGFSNGYNNGQMAGQNGNGMGVSTIYQVGQTSYGQNGQVLGGQGQATGNFGQTIGVVTQLSGSSSNTVVSPAPAPDFSFAAGCPLGSRPLVRTDRTVAECADQPCPNGFACVFAEREDRFQCCSSSSIMLASGKPEEEAPPTPESKMECPPGFYMIDGKCLKVLFAGQKGCISNDQCSAREKNSTCDSGYCICPADKPLVHGGKCISNCPEGFANIAGRCYDPTTVIFMDSVDERGNGTIGGYCLETLVEEKRCNVANAYCSEKTITCQCKPGFDLKMDFENSEDQGSCTELESTKFAQMDDVSDRMPEIDDELYFIDISPVTAVEVGNSTSNDDSDADLNRYLFQSDEMIPAFA